MENYKINPELECVNLTKDQQERLERLKPVDLEDLLKNAKENNIELTYRGIDANGIPHIKIRQR
ncbi:hypothetical protein ES695_10615 [Candidatus Atribacteria bacterium 1244-E10-H5-B2]|nr:MAG: hypothetical protein ES695_10615 [Candidatus Atribacteria bacterium 1244-E10-H5-B2]